MASCRIARLGHPLLDRQHRRMAEQARDFIAAARRGRGLGELGRLIRTTERHFITEDRLMVGQRYPERRGHNALHTGVMNDMLRMHGELRDGRAVHRELAAQAMVWLAHHTDEADRNLVAFLARRKR